MTESSRQHDRTHFFKYMPAETARKVLLTRRLRWSSPFLFNDPFDVPRDIAHGFTATDITRASIELLNRHLDEPPTDLADFDDTLAQVLSLARQGFPRELREQMRATIADTLPTFQSDGALQELRDHWKAVVPTLRILCLAESPNHVAMWNHYANGYQGVVLGFQCNDETDNFLLVAQPIEYLKSKPDVYTDAGIAKLLCLKPMAASRALRRLATQTKSDDWSYEKEWRVVDYADDGDSSHYSDRGFAANDLSHIYLGPLIQDQDRDHILALARRYPKAQIFQTSIGLDRELHFQEHEA